MGSVEPCKVAHEALVVVAGCRGLKAMLHSASSLSGSTGKQHRVGIVRPCPAEVRMRPAEPQEDLAVLHASVREAQVSLCVGPVSTGVEALGHAAHATGAYALGAADHVMKNGTSSRSPPMRRSGPDASPSP